MNFLRKTIKFIFFGLILFILSLFYRFFGDHGAKDDKSAFLDTDEAKADVPSSCGVTDTFGTSSCMCSSK